jgi:hypothetical protein
VTTDRYTPRREDRFSFGLWAVRWQDNDVFGGAVRPPMPAERAVRKLGLGLDAGALGRRGMGFERLDQLALEHPYGIR